MERDFMGLSSTEPMAVKEEVAGDGFRDSGFGRSSGLQWPFSNKISTLPLFMPFKHAHEDHKSRKNISETHVLPVFDSVPVGEAFEQSQNYNMLEFQKSFNIDRQQGGPNFAMAAYRMQHDVHSISNQQAVPVTMGKPFSNQKLLGGIPVTSPHIVLPSLTDSWNNAKTSGTPQITIFYGGTVNVYEGISPAKAHAIMQLAETGSQRAPNPLNLKSQALWLKSKQTSGDVSQPTNAPNPGLSSQLSVSSHNSGSGSTSTDDLAAANTSTVPNTPTIKVEPSIMMNVIGSVAATAMIPSAVPQARKASLARFLEKRKERMMNLAPYNLCMSSSECAAESNGANFAASPAIDSTLH